VRENRTPGSVRGLLGNWQSYRDAAPATVAHIIGVWTNATERTE